jgi:hypothetical protein
MQLVAYGAQDVYLTGNPKVTFFQAVYKRHTNFAMETIQQTLNGTVGNGNRVSVTIARNGDLVGYMYVELTPKTDGNLRYTTDNSNVDVNWMAERAFSAIELTIGGQRIDKHYQTWWRLYSELFLGDEGKVKYAKMATYAAEGTATAAAGTVHDSSKVYLPLLFFFNRNPGLYLPLIALQYHEVRLDFDCASNFADYFSTSTQPVVWANYVFLDTEERRRFAQKSHEYLIEQVQHTGGDSLGTGTSAQLVRLSLNHPVKELVWCYQDSLYAMGSTARNSLWNFSTNAANVQVTIDTSLGPTPNTIMFAQTTGVPRQLITGATTSVLQVEEGIAVAGGAEVGPLSSFKLILNGQDRFKEQTGKYFNQIQPYFHHTGTPYPGIYSYSFALQPEEHQPTGTCNFSRIDNAQVSVALKAGTAKTQKLFAVNYNVLRISSGMGGELAFRRVASAA